MEFLNNLVSSLNPFGATLSMMKMVILGILAIVVLAMVYSYMTREKMTPAARAIKIREFT